MDCDASSVCLGGSDFACFLQWRWAAYCLCFLQVNVTTCRSRRRLLRLYLESRNSINIYMAENSHLSLTTILRSKRALSSIAATHIQWWAILLTAYNYEVKYRSTKEHTNANALSCRLLLKQNTKTCQSPAAALNVRQTEMLPVSLKWLQKETSRDPILSQVVKQGWPCSVPDCLKPFFHWKFTLTVEAECLLWGMRVVVPAACQGAVLKEYTWVTQELCIWSPMSGGQRYRGDGE